jgi:hypothetical protein
VTDNLRAKLMSVQKLSDREELNADAIAGLSDQVMKLTIELQQIKGRSDY